MASGKPMRVALTGGIACGKSTVAALFAELGVAIVDLDEIAREVVTPGSALLAQVLERFGPELRCADGSLDRRALRERVFDGSRSTHGARGAPTSGDSRARRRTRSERPRPLPDHCHPAAG